MCETVLCGSGKAITELGYRPSTLETMLLDCYEWLLEAKILIAKK
jgi:nucleoside-diphosphate-sugar epimerase